MSQWEKNYIKNLRCDSVVTKDNDAEFLVEGYEPDIHSQSTIIYWAANPPTYNGSFSGSGLPFPNPEIAYHNTINKGTVKIIGGNYSFKIRYPNSYYVGLGSTFVEPCVHIKICQPNGEDIVKTIKLKNSIPFRSLNHPSGQRGTIARNNSLFYKKLDKGPRTQEQILREGSYPMDNKMPQNFWG